MYKRTFKTLLAASVIGVAIPVQAAMGKPTADSGGPVVVQKSTPPIVSEKVAGLNLQVQRTAPIVSGTLDPSGTAIKPSSAVDASNLCLGKARTA